MRALDQLGSLFDSLGKKISEFSEVSKIAEIIKFSLEIDSIEIKLFSFSLIGDCATHASFVIQQYVPKFINTLIEELIVLPSNIDPGYFTLSICKKK